MLIYHQAKQYLQHNRRHRENFANADKYFSPDAKFSERLAATTLVMPDTSRVWGVDISHWNLPPVNLKRMVEMYHLDFVIIKGCDGSLNTKHYPEHVAAAKEAGIPWGMYCWLYSNGNVSIEAQTTAWNNRAKSDPPPMGIFIDAETTYYNGLLANPNATDLRSAHDKIKVKYGKPATTYTAKYFADTYLKGFDWSREELWVANYGVSIPALPTGAKGYAIHQFTATLDGKQLDPNGNAELDGNYHALTHEQFAAQYGTPPTGGGDTMLYGKINTSALNVRTGAGASYQDIGDLIQSDYVIASESVGGWWHLIDARRGSWTGAQVALANGTTVKNRATATNDVWCSGSYIVNVDPPDNEPSPVIKTHDIEVYDDGSIKIDGNPYP